MTTPTTTTRSRPYLPLHVDEVAAIKAHLAKIGLKPGPFYRAAVLEVFEDSELMARVVRRARNE